MTVSEGIIINDLTTGFGSKKSGAKVLHQKVNLQLLPGQLVCMLGPNGAGKSTLLKTMLGFQSPLAGMVFFKNLPLDKLSVKEMARLVSVVLTDKIDDIYLSASEIIATGRYPFGSFTGKLSSEDLIRIRNSEKAVGVSHLSENKFSQLSDGEKQKVMIARALVQETPFIFLDEPVAFIDAPGRISIMQLLHKLVADLGKGILMATHDLDSALNYADNIWLMGNNGQWDHGEPEELIAEGKINRFFDREQITFDRQKKRFVWTNKTERSNRT